MNIPEFAFAKQKVFLANHIEFRKVFKMKLTERNRNGTMKVK